VLFYWIIGLILGSMYIIFEICHVPVPGMSVLIVSFSVHYDWLHFVFSYVRGRLSVQQLQICLLLLPLTAYDCSSYSTRFLPVPPRASAAVFFLSSTSFAILVNILYIEIHSVMIRKFNTVFS
jgi:hypothetical protein